MRICFPKKSDVIQGKYINGHEVASEEQEEIRDYLIRCIYYDVPVRSTKMNKEINKKSIWIEPLPSVHERNVNEDIANSVPSGIMIDSSLKIRITFLKYDMTYVLDGSNIFAHKLVSKQLNYLKANPPVLEKATSISIQLTWQNLLPFPVGIIQRIELQFCSIPWNVMNSYENIHRMLLNGELKWSALVSKSYYMPNFLNYTFDHLRPGSGHIFRIRINDSMVWSEWSLPSKIFHTLPDLPMTPPMGVPRCVALTSTAVEFSWEDVYHDYSIASEQYFMQRLTNPNFHYVPPLSKLHISSKLNSDLSNGTPIVEYVLLAKATGSSADDYIELYRGPKLRYVELGLFPEQAYSFKLAVVNLVGTSEFSSMVSVHTPKATRSKVKHPVTLSDGIDIVPVNGYSSRQMVRAYDCLEAWKVYWDRDTEQPFYFNTVLGLRQTHQPKVLQVAMDDVEGGPVLNSLTLQDIDPISILDEIQTQPLVVVTHEVPVEEEMMTKEVEMKHKKKFLHQKLSEECQKAFRIKRIQLYKALRKRQDQYHQHRQVTETSPSTPSPSHRALSLRNARRIHVSDASNESSTAMIQQEPMDLPGSDTIELHADRDHLLRDFYQFFISSSKHDLLGKRFKVIFQNEDGIDSGGLSREAFLLVSQDISLFVGPQCCSWMKWWVDTTSGRLSHDNDPSDWWMETYSGWTFQTNSLLQPSASTSSFGHDDLEEASAAKIKRLEKFKNDYRINSSEFFYFLGRFLAKALIERHLLDLSLSSMLLQQVLGGIMGNTVTAHDNDKYSSPRNVARSTSSKSPSRLSTSNLHQSDSVKTEVLLKTYREQIKEEVIQMLRTLRPVNPELHQKLHWMANNSIANIIYETFTVMIEEPLQKIDTKSRKNLKKEKESDPLHQRVTMIPLRSNGENMEVTDDNKFEYIKLLILWNLRYSVLQSLEPFLRGFYELIPLEIFQSLNFTQTELGLLINGKQKNVVVEDLRAYCLYQTPTLDEPFDEQNQIIIWLWRYVRKISNEEKLQFLAFFTGTTKIPLDGYDPPIIITDGSSYMEKNSLPRAHTCFHQLVLPNYDNYFMFKDRFMYALENTEGFQLT